jgi:tetratricopeptide (TPR) repeat protein
MNRAALLLLSSLLSVSSLEAADLIGNKSPDGRFGLLLKKNSEFEGSVIEIRSREELLDLGVLTRNFGKFGALLWSPDSKRLAAYSSARRGGDTAVYVFEGSKFVEIKVPDWDAPLPKHENVTKVVEDDFYPLHWSGPDTLVLKREWELLTQRDGHNGEQNESESNGAAILTLRFDSHNKASLQSAKVMPAQASKAVDLVLEGRDRLSDGNGSEALAKFNAALKADPTNVDAYVGRGDLRETAGNYDGAIADYTRAIELLPLGAYAALVGRGDAMQAKGASDAAIADYDRAIDLCPTKGVAYNSRAIVKQAKGDYDGAIADYSLAIDLDPDPSYYYNRGTANSAKRDWANALADFRQSRKLNSGDKDSPIMIWVILAKQGEKIAADTELSTDLEKPLKEAPEEWTSSVANFLLDKLSETDFLSIAQSGAKPATRRDQTCDAWYYAGIKRLLAGDKSTAIDDLRKCLATKDQTEDEYQCAEAELQALGE